MKIAEWTAEASQQKWEVTVKENWWDHCLHIFISWMRRTTQSTVMINLSAEWYNACCENLFQKEHDNADDALPSVWFSSAYHSVIECNWNRANYQNWRFWKHMISFCLLWDNICSYVNQYLQKCVYSHSLIIKIFSWEKISQYFDQLYFLQSC